MTGQVRVITERHEGTRSAYRAEVSAQGVPTTSVAIKAGGTGQQGTLVCFSGGQGTGSWSASDPARSVLKRLRKAGWKTVEIRWPNGWLMGAKTNGPKVLAVRPATVLDWVRDTLHVGGTFAATGNSGGAGAVAYAISHYGVRLDLTVLTGGPVFSTLAHGCSQQPPLGYERDGAVRTVDMSYGHIGPDERTTGPCYLQATTCLQYTSRLNGDSIVSYGANYALDNVHFILGGDDRPSNINQARWYYDNLVSVEAPPTWQIVQGVGHTVQDFPAGAQAIFEAVSA